MVRDEYTDVSFRYWIVAFMFTADCGFTLFLLFLPLSPIFFCLSADELLFLWVNPILIVCTDSDPHIFTLSVKAIQKKKHSNKKLNGGGTF